MKVKSPDLWGEDGNMSSSPSWSEERAQLTRRLFELEQELHRQRLGRKWYLVVIVLLYVGLLASFSLNVSLLLRKPQTRSAPLEPQITTDFPFQQSTVLDKDSVLDKNLGFSYTTPCLVAVPCKAGEFYDCVYAECRPCPQGSYQPHWGQTSCWPCPANTTTDSQGASKLSDCKSQECPFYTREGVGIMESPNFPREFPSSISCRWRVRPGHSKRVILILPQLSLPPDCSSKLVIRQDSKPVLDSCSSRKEPYIVTGHSSNLWVEFSSGEASATGFQLTALSVHEELGYLVDAVVSTGDISNFDNPQDKVLSPDDKILLSRLLLLLNPTYPSNSEEKSALIQNRHSKPVIEVLEDNNHNNKQN